MQIVKLKVSATLLSLLSALALKHIGDTQIGIRNLDLIMNLGFIFLFGRMSVRGKFIIPSGFSSDLLPKVVCLCNLLSFSVSQPLSLRL